MEAIASKKIALREQIRARLAKQSSADVHAKSAAIWERLSVVREFAAATRLVLQSEAAGRRANLREVLERAGVKPFVLQKAERQIRLLGRQRGSQLYRWLLQADLDLKGESTMPPRAILERLVVRLAAPQDPAGKRRPA